MAIIFQFQKKIFIRDTRKLKAFIEKLFYIESKDPGRIAYIFCDDEYLRDLNNQFLQHDYYTDILSFNMSDKDDHITNAEIYISIDRVRDNSQCFSQPFKSELLRVVFHGALHLCGYRDKTPEQKQIMTHKETEYLKMFHVEHSKTKEQNVS